MAKKPQRPLTEREIRQAKRERDAEEYIVIYNISKMSIPIQLQPPAGVDFFQGEQTIYLHKGKSGRFPKSRLRDNQIQNLRKSGRIRTEMSSAEAV